MHLHSYRLKNFRRLKDAHIELADDISIFVSCLALWERSCDLRTYAICKRSFSPLRLVFRDAGFADDAAKINVEQMLKQLSPMTEVKAI